MNFFKNIKQSIISNLSGEDFYDTELTKLAPQYFFTYKLANSFTEQELTYLLHQCFESEYDQISFPLRDFPHENVLNDIPKPLRYIFCGDELFKRYLIDHRTLLEHRYELGNFSVLDIFDDFPIDKDSISYFYQSKFTNTEKKIQFRFNQMQHVCLFRAFATSKLNLIKHRISLLQDEIDNEKLDTLLAESIDNKIETYVSILLDSLDDFPNPSELTIAEKDGSEGGWYPYNTITLKEKINITRALYEEINKIIIETSESSYSNLFRYLESIARQNTFWRIEWAKAFDAIVQIRGDCLHPSILMTRSKVEDHFSYWDRIGKL